MSCYYHPNRDSVIICSACGRPVCAGCSYVTGTHPMCRHCWELRISNTKAGASNKPVKTKKSEKKERPKIRKTLPPEKLPPGLETTEFIAPEPAVYDRPKVEPPAYPVKEMSIPYEPRHVDTPAQAKPFPPAEPITKHEKSAGPIIYHEPTAPAPQPLHAETETPVLGGASEQAIKHEKPKAKLNIGNRARGLLGSLSKLKPSFGGKGKKQEGPHYVQVAHQTFRCYQCGAENEDDALFCQVCGTWFQHHDTLVEPQELPQQQEPITENLQAAPADPIMHQAPKENEFQPSHVEPSAQTTPTTAESIIYLGPPAQVPQPLYVEPEPQIPWSMDEQLANYEKPKPKLDLGKRVRRLFGSRFKPKPGSGGKGKQQKGPHYVQVAQQTFQCHQCGAENYIGELFCQSCGSWFQYTCPGCGAVVDPSFDSCPSCLTELGWEHTAEEEYHGYP